MQERNQSLAYDTYLQDCVELEPDYHAGKNQPRYPGFGDTTMPSYSQTATNTATHRHHLLHLFIFAGTLGWAA